VPDAFALPAGVTMGAPASVAFLSNGHILVLSRGQQAFFEFDERGTYVRSFGAQLPAARPIRARSISAELARACPGARHPW